MPPNSMESWLYYSLFTTFNSLKYAFCWGVTAHICNINTLEADEEMRVPFGR